MRDLDLFLTKELNNLTHIDHIDHLPCFRLWTFDLSTLSTNDGCTNFNYLVDDIFNNPFIVHITLFNLEISSDFTWLELYLAKRSVAKALHENLRIPRRTIKRYMRKHAWFWLLPAIQASFSRQIA